MIGTIPPIETDAQPVVLQQDDQNRNRESTSRVRQQRLGQFEAQSHPKPECGYKEAHSGGVVA
ncbi:hypothetical protein SAMN06269185_3348 [Natronoarchaeum philippinense]|uniref:Uncharacterized protein n=1 Tax=Natronoarchaeum philippinense TaxID=558529 RepID=A0A285PE05_NATPI|nr:hypothetical protein SAMN06269185_3348 [Natronoarchaeum philippinense]